MCRDCEVGMWEEEQICPVCGRNSRYGLRHTYCKGEMEGLVCLWAYEGVTRKIITRAKYSGQFDVLEFLISNFEFLNKLEMFKFLEFIEVRPKVVPVPLHPKRNRERGFNQSKVISLSLSRNFNLEVGDLLTRVKETKPQAGRSRAERLEAMEGAFAINSKFSVPQNILLVDDVWTTGATMRECVKTLRKGGVKKVWGWVLAR